MEPRAHHVMIGLFTLLFTVAMVVFALWLSRAHQQGQIDHYKVIFDEPVRGLSRGSAVLYNGIRIGEVQDMHLDAADLREAHVQLALDADIPIRTDTRARLVMTGVTGTAVVELSGGSPLSPLLAESVDKDEEGDPVIRAVPSPLNQLLSGGDNLLTRVSELVMNANDLFTSDNLEHFGNIMANMDAFSEQLVEHGDDVGSVIRQVAEVSKRIAAVTSKASGLIDTTTNLVTDQGQRAFEHGVRALASLEEATVSMNHVMQGSSESIISGSKGLNELGPTMRALRRTLASIQEVVRKLDENPGRYLLGHDDLQEFEP